jgi:anti-sigma factor RsiW
MKEFEPNFDAFPIEWLAGYIDGELDTQQTAIIESWLADHPEALEKLRTQQSLSIKSDEFARQVAPILPSESAWAKVFANIEVALDKPTTSPTQPKSNNTWWLASALALITTAASIFLVWTLPSNLVPVHSETVQTDGLMEPIQLASADEVEILSLDESAASGLVVGRHPLDTYPLVLVSFEDFDLHGVEPDDAGEFPELQMTPHGARSPMIWAVSPSPK